MTKVHFLGIGGSGASAIAAIAQAQGFEVTGCDKVPFNEFTTSFDKSSLSVGHSAQHLEDGIEILAVTPAIFSLDSDNEELQTAKKMGISILTWQQFMGKYLEKDKLVVAVCGTHGKSTTTAMIGLMLEDAGLDPTVELGATVPRWKANYRVGKGKYFVTEADEFNDNFLVTHPDIAVVTTIEMDHPEYFKDFEAYKQSFAKFLDQTKETIIANLSDPGVIQTLACHPRGGNVIQDYSRRLIDFSPQVPGQHNMMNASAAYQVGLALGINPEVIKKSLRSFSGIGRRFEYLGKFEKAEIYSDFAHHPTEIKVTLKAAREKFPQKRLVVVFQPHMFSRTKVLFDDFVKVFQDLPADQVYILDIYPGREKDTGLVSSQQLVGTIHKPGIEYAKTEDILTKIEAEAEKEVVIFFMGAGVNHDLAKQLISAT